MSKNSLKGHDFIVMSQVKKKKANLGIIHWTKCSSFFIYLNSNAHVGNRNGSYEVALDEYSKTIF